jgi:hypothetical protein
MKKIETSQLEMTNGGGPILCGVAVVGFGIAAASLFTTGVGAPLGAVLLASQGYVAATIGLAGCFYDF